MTKKAVKQKADKKSCTALSPGTVIVVRLQTKSAATLHALQHPPIPLLQKTAARSDSKGVAAV